MQITRIVLLFCLLALSSCTYDPVEINIQSNDQVVLFDSTNLAMDAIQFDSRGMTAFYPVHYLGKPADTILLGHRPVSSLYDEERDAKYDTARNWASITAENMNILVDTSLEISHKSYFSHFGDNMQEKVDSAAYYKAFPIFIMNRSDSLLLVGSHSMVRWMTREVKDHNGQWIEIEKPIRDLCGTARRDIIIDPGNILIAKLIRYKGDELVECRLKYKYGKQVVYSNVFIDYIYSDQALEKSFPQ